MKTYLGIGSWITAPFQHRTLFWGFLCQDIKSRYVGSMFGPIWTVLVPLAQLLIYIFVFSHIFKIRLTPEEVGTESFVLFLLAGLLPWIAFSEAVGSSSGIFLGRANLITKVAFPVELLPLSCVGVVFFMNGIGMLLYLGYMTAKGYMALTWLLFPVVLGIHMLFTLGIVIFLASLSVFIRDTQQVIGVIISLWMYLTPILYPVSMVPESVRWALGWNPMFSFIELYHQILLNQTVSIHLLARATGWGCLAFVWGIFFFNKSRPAFADVM